MRFFIAIASVLFWVGSGSGAWADLSIVPARSSPDTEEPSPMPSPRQDPVEDPAAQVLRERTQLAGQFVPLNASNPVSSDFALLQEFQKNEKLRASLKFLADLGADPRMQKLVLFGKREDVQELILKIWKHPSFKLLPWYQLGWGLLIWLLGAWWRSLGSGFLRQVGIRFVIFLAFSFGVWGMVPGFILGAPYFELLRLIFQKLL